MGAQLCKQVSAKTNDVAGDGTTTATVLANALVANGLKYISSGGNPISVKIGMEYAAEKVVDIIENLAKPIESKEQITFVATISGNEAEVGQIVADAMEAVGKDGVITIEESRGRETFLSLVEGMKFDKGYVSAFFVNNAEKWNADIQTHLFFCMMVEFQTQQKFFQFLLKLMNKRNLL